MNRIFVWLSYLVLAAAAMLLLYFLSEVFVDVRDWFLEVYQTGYEYFEEFMADLEAI
jgi:hypothetical protein